MCGCYVGDITEAGSSELNWTGLFITYESGLLSVRRQPVRCRICCLQGLLEIVKREY